MKHSPSRVGFYQAIGLAAYIAVFATILSQVQAWTQTPPVSIPPAVGISLFLLAFVISALISGSIALARPAMLFFDGHKLDAVKIIFWNAVWLVAILLVAAVVLFTMR